MKKSNEETKQETLTLQNSSNKELTTRRNGEVAISAQERAEEIRRGWDSNNLQDHSNANLKLTIRDKEPGWSYRWVKDTETSILDMKKKGWEVHSPRGLESAGGKEGQTKLIPMKIPTIIYDEYQRNKHRNIEMSEDEMLDVNNLKQSGLSPQHIARGSKLQIGNKKATFGNTY